MKIVHAYLRAFRRGFTYDVRRNVYLWFGVLWGVPVPIFSIGLDLTLSDHGIRPPWETVLAHPIHIFFLLHPLLFGLVFGAMGTVRHALQEENEALIRRLTEQATLDPLTGLKNRRVVIEELQAALHRAARGGPAVAVILIDLNGFKAVNDRRGHTAGDEVLRAIADALRSVVRVGETLGRYGGDEFLLVAAGAAEDAEVLVQRALRAIESASGLTACAGISQGATNGATPEELINAADRELAAAKKKHYECRGMTKRIR